MKKTTLLLLSAILLFFCSCGNKAVKPDYTKWEIKDGKFYLDGKWKFLKIAKPLINFADSAAVDRYIQNLDLLKEKNFDAFELNCYWHHFDKDGDGVPEMSLASLNRLIDAIYEKGMYPCLTVETYAVGGGQIPQGFWERYPDAEAIDNKGNKVSDTEYGFGGKVISIFHEGYRETVHNYIKNLAKGIDTKKILWFETTVEPQYMGTIPLCYSESARKEYNAWRAENGITDAESEMPTEFPIPDSFVQNETWNKFRAQFLAKWVNEDAAAYREVAGEDAYVAVDYLETSGHEMYLRNGNSDEFLRNLTGANIIQVNWHWHLIEKAPHQKAYDRIHRIMKEENRDWAISEHMTFNGSDFTPEEAPKVLENTLQNGTRLGWEFVTVTPSTKSSFSLYNDDFSPKDLMREVDDKWDYWMERVKEIEKSKK